MEFLIVLGVGAVLLGAVCIGQGIRMRREAQIARKWPVVQGKVVESHVISQVYPLVRPDSSETILTLYEPLVRYAYDVGQQSYAGRRIAAFFFPRNVSLAESKAVCNRYPEGGAVTVHYSPLEPQEAVLEPKAPPIARYPGLIIGIWFVVLGSVTAVLGGVLL